ncbi:MAG: GTPase HflX [Pseudanabaenaceae cyanobacterium SKYGB_i_bin29]|nr:GTPase HflX [Pseudanabaenaceae cyanobacterium SKYG29]MDW8420313.1 GTPase HflX [Pseudanabaenaceae cyanobacterium SKYGB_i_bin29]
MPQDVLTTPEFAQRLALISQEVGASVSAYINRRGQVVRVGVGTPAQTRIPPQELPRYGETRLSGIRCITTDLLGAPIGTADLTAMVMQRLDALVSCQVRSEGRVGKVYVAHLLPQVSEKPWYVFPAQSLDVVAKQDFLGLVSGLEEEFQREFRAQAVDLDTDRVIIVGVQTAKQSDMLFQATLEELAQLVISAGGQVLQTFWQRREQPHPQTIVGEGKIKEIALACQTLGANLLVFDRELSPAQIRNLESMTGIRVSDRTEVILDIFAQRARSAAGKLQVELAQLAYRLPRLTGRGEALSRLGGGIGTRGPGETKLETDRRVIQKRITFLQQQVSQLRTQRARMRQHRLEQAIPTIAIVGYTNAGKSTLLNALTKADVYSADQLFATLDPTTRKLFLPNGTTVLLTDTVGFIHELPPSLQNAFRATLEEVTTAHALLHVVDSSHPHWQTQIKAVEKILAQTLADCDNPLPTLLVFNKIDRTSDLTVQRALYPQAVFVSATDRQGLDDLLQSLVLLSEQMGRDLPLSASI